MINYINGICRESGPPQAGNPALQDSLFLIRFLPFYAAGGNICILAGGLPSVQDNRLWQAARLLGYAGPAVRALGCIRDAACMPGRT